MMNEERDRRPNTGEMSSEIQFTWTETPQTLEDIINSSGIPSVVKMWRENSTDEKAPALDIHKPLLLYKELEDIKVYFKNVTSVDLLAGATCKEDPIVVMPLSYKGWFRLIDDRDKPLSTISSVARIMPKKFLSHQLVSGYTRDIYTTNSNLAEPLYMKIDIQPTILKAINVREDFVRYTSHRKVVKRKLLRCLVCKTPDETEILLPFETHGIFYLIEVKKSTSKHINVENIGYAYGIKDMHAAGLSKGVILRLLHGRPPSKPCGFTQILKVCDIVQDHTCVACTVDEQKRLLELPIAPVPLFVKALNFSTYNLHQTYIDTVNYLEKHGNEYASEIKVRHNYSIDKKEQKKTKDEKN